MVSGVAVGDSSVAEGALTCICKTQHTPKLYICYFRLYSETKLTLLLDSNSSKYPSSVVGVGLTRV